jgi:U3 small nucleolar RNA-associated protein 19
LTRNSSAEVVHKSVWALYRVFGGLIAGGRVGGITGNGEPEARALSGKEAKDGGAREVKGWVRDRLLEFVEVLGGMLHDTETGLRVSTQEVARS